MTFLGSMKIASATVGVVLISAVTISQFSNAQQRINFSPPTPPDPGTPADRGQAGGSRGPCDDVYTGLTALVPSPHTNAPEDRWGLTVSDRPAIWFNVPTGIAAGTLVEWRLRDDRGKTLYKTSTRLPKTNPGVIAFRVPAAKPLAIATYQWDLALYCNSAGGSANPDNTTFDQPLVRKGRIQRVATPPALQQELKQAKTSLDQAKLYARYGVWYDALTALGAQIQATQNNKAVLDAWNELLRNKS